MGTINDLATLGAQGWEAKNLNEAIPLTESRASNVDDDDKILTNTGASNFTLTIAANTIVEGVVLQQLSTGTVTVAAGAGVTFVGTSLATSAAGQMLAVVATATDNTYIVKLSA